MTARLFLLSFPGLCLLLPAGSSPVASDQREPLLKQTEHLFSPTPAMRRYAHACVAPEVRPDRPSRCEAAGISYRTLNRWEADPGFLAWLPEQITRLLKQQAWQVWAVVNTLARNGNLTAAKLLLDRFSPDLAASDDDRPQTFLEIAELAEALRGGGATQCGSPERSHGDRETRKIKGAPS